MPKPKSSGRTKEQIEANAKKQLAIAIAKDREKELERKSELRMKAIQSGGWGTLKRLARELIHGERTYLSDRGKKRKKGKAKAKGTGFKSARTAAIEAELKRSGMSVDDVRRLRGMDRR
jgi:hypothetical protein